MSYLRIVRLFIALMLIFSAKIVLAEGLHNAKVHANLFVYA